MPQAKIEIRTRDVKGLPIIPKLGAAQHLFIIHTDSAGKESILRGGTETNSLLAMFSDNLKIVNVPYERKNENLFPDDLVLNAPSKVLVTGTDNHIQGLVDKMWGRAQEINAANYDYKLPIPNCPIDICHVQNSNTAVSEMLKAAGLKLELPTVKGKPAWAPGVNSYFKYTTTDEAINAYRQYVQDHPEMASDSGMLYDDSYSSTRFQNTYTQSDYQESMNKVTELFDMFKQPEVSDPELNNVQRFQLLADQQRAKGNYGYAANFDNLGAQTNAVLDFLGSLKSQNEDND